MTTTCSNELHQAIWNNDIQKTEELIGQNFEMDAKDGLIHGLRSLDIAVIKNNQKIVQLLLSEKNPNRKQIKIDEIVWQYAIFVNNEAIISQLVDSCSPLENIKNHLGETLLHQAILRKSIRLMKLFVESNVCIESRTVNGYTPLHYAVMENNVEMVEFLLAKKASIFAKTEDGRGPLHLAVKSGCMESLMVLLEHKADVNDCVTSTGSYPLHIAAEEGDETTFNFLLRQGTNLFCKDNNDRNVLHLAVEYGHENLMKILLKKEFNINDVTSDGLSALSIALKNGNESMAKWLLNCNPDINLKDKHGMNPMFWALKNKCSAISREILRMGCDITCLTDDNSSLLHYALEYDNQFVALSLIETGIDITLKNSAGQTALHLAAKYSCSTMVKALINDETNVNEKSLDGSTPLHNAFLNKNESDVPKIIYQLISCKADPNAENHEKETSLHLAIPYGNPQIIELLLSKGANPNLFDENGLSPLRIAIEKELDEENEGHFIESVLIRYGADVNNVDIIKNNALHELFFCTPEFITYYLEHGTEINGLNDKLETPLHHSIMHSGWNRDSQRNPIELLIKHGASFQSNGKGESPLHLAIASYNYPAIKFFLKQGLDVNIAAVDGSTALHYALFHSKGKFTAEIIKLLLVNNANTNAINDKGETPLCIATSNNDSIEIVELLLNYKSDVNMKDKDGKSPLYHAVCNKNIDIVKLLLKKKASTTVKYNGKTIYDLADEKGDKHIYQLFLLYQTF